jgi:hypothetical protein
VLSAVLGVGGDDVFSRRFDPTTAPLEVFEGNTFEAHEGALFRIDCAPPPPLVTTLFLAGVPTLLPLAALLLLLSGLLLLATGGFNDDDNEEEEDGRDDEEEEDEERADAVTLLSHLDAELPELVVEDEGADLGEAATDGGAPNAFASERKGVRFSPRHPSKLPADDAWGCKLEPSCFACWVNEATPPDLSGPKTKPAGSEREGRAGGADFESGLEGEAASEFCCWWFGLVVLNEAARRATTPPPALLGDEEDEAAVSERIG